jgi:plasmid maintenance system antidote protein VapI
MTPAELETIGRALYGERWQSSLARALKVAPRTMRRWAAGKSRMPEAIGADLAKLVDVRQQALMSLAPSR